MGGCSGASSTMLLARRRDIFSPTLTIVSRIAVCTVLLYFTPKDELKMSGASLSRSTERGLNSTPFELFFASDIKAAVCAISDASCANNSFLSTKSVSQFSSTMPARMPPAVLKPPPSERIDMAMTPCVVERDPTLSSFDSPEAAISFSSHESASGMELFDCARASRIFERGNWVCFRSSAMREMEGLVGGAEE